MEAPHPVLRPEPPEAIRYWALAADRAKLSAMMVEFEQICTDWGVPRSASFNLELAIDELVTNSISYGFNESEAKPDIRVAAATEADTVAVCIEDNGAPFDPFEEAPAPDFELGIEEQPVGGLGVHLVKNMVEEYRYERLDGYNRLLLRMALAGK